eukprot:gb/GFBE01028966.1/.p1 GENE.gb/GFBE01028966.1/~~gb/GFBE01028966.1/.p1  ORF type:complete len:268 (+),score=58.44 gb/GFBE01028966.1/:1-804(+)
MKGHALCAVCLALVAQPLMAMKQRLPTSFAQNLPGPLFIHIPKTAGTSIWEAMGPKYTDSNRYPEVPFFCMKHNPPAVDHVPDSWAIVRDPCDRLVSEFIWASRLAWFRKYEQKNPGVNLTNGLNCDVFNAWVSTVMQLYKNESSLEDCHLIPQWCYASKVDKLLPLDAQLEDRIHKMDSRLSYVKLPHRNEDPSSVKKAVGCGCLTPENLKAVQDHFFVDFRNLRSVLGESKWAPKDMDDPALVAQHNSTCAAFYRGGKVAWERKK